MDRSSRKKVNKETMTLNETLGWVDLIDLYRTLDPNAAKYTFLSAHGTFSRIDHMFDIKQVSIY